MRTQSKKIIPILLVVGLCGGYTASFAEEHGKEEHPAQQAVVHDVHDLHTQSAEDSTKNQAEHPAVNPAAGKPDHNAHVAEAHGTNDHAAGA
ncbi:MAG: hypothetical protein D3916_16475 [Candidatus Electrothrix sp. MAN1_4]|nr:hypothetical protein [Candidatus Electrothrix sp. MAN1_4]